MGSCLAREREIGWEVEFEVAGIQAKKLMDGFHEPDQRKMNEVWSRVAIEGMHGMKKIHASTDGHLGGKGAIYESYDKNGVMQTRHEMIHYEIQDEGESIFTEIRVTANGPLLSGFNFKNDDHGLRIKLTNTKNGNVRLIVECIAVFHGRSFWKRFIKLMYPMVRFQKAIQDVMAPKGNPKTVHLGTMGMKTELVYKTSRQVVGLLGAEQQATLEEKIREHFVPPLDEK